MPAGHATTPRAITGRRGSAPHTRNSGARGHCQARHRGSLSPGDGSDLEALASLLPSGSGRGVRARHDAEGSRRCFPAAGGAALAADTKRAARRFMAAGRGPERKDGCAPLPPSPRLQMSADPKPKTFTCQRAASRPARGGRARPLCPSLTWLGRFRGRLGHGWRRTGERRDGDRLPGSRPAVRGGAASAGRPRPRRGCGGRSRDEGRVPGGSLRPRHRPGPGRTRPISVPPRDEAPPLPCLLSARPQEPPRRRGRGWDWAAREAGTAPAAARRGSREVGWGVVCAGQPRAGGGCGPDCSVTGRRRRALRLRGALVPGGCSPSGLGAWLELSTNSGGTEVLELLLVGARPGGSAGPAVWARTCERRSRFGPSAPSGVPVRGSFAAVCP